MERSKFIDGQIMDAVKRVESGLGGSQYYQKTHKAAIKYYFIIIISIYVDL